MKHVRPRSRVADAPRSPRLASPRNAENERLFACVQRGHQQAFETYSQFLALSLVSSVLFPITTALEGALWIAARLAWADGYASGKPDERYSHRLAPHIWTPVIHMALLSLYTAGRFLYGSV